MEDILKNITELGVSYGGKLLLAMVALIVGLLVIRSVRNMLRKFLDSDSIDKTLQVVIKNVVMIVLYAILIISVIPDFIS